MSSVRLSAIGEQQVKHTRLRTRATHYRNMAAAIQAGNEPTIAKFPKYIPRGKPVSWYLERAERDMQDSEWAGELAKALSETEHQQRLERMTVEERCEDIEDRLSSFTYLEGEFGLLRDLRELLKGVPAATVRMYRNRVSTLYAEVLQCFDDPERPPADDEAVPVRHLRPLPMLIDDHGQRSYPFEPICAVFGLHPHAVWHWLSDDERENRWTVSDGRPVQAGYLTEAGLMRILMASHHPLCTALQRWLAHVVIPSLLAEGQYTCGAEAQAVFADLPMARPAEA
jgi:hypothetical protein